MNEVPMWRQAVYYVGFVLVIIGFLLFLSVFISFIKTFGDFSDFENRTRNEMMRAFGGMVLASMGEFLRRVGARGLSGSGVVLDPKQAREDLKPYSHMIGGIASDVLEEFNNNTEQKVMIRCQSCKTLNEENSKFCQECGKEL